VSAEIGDVVERFGVGAPAAPPRPLGGGSSSRVCALDTSGGRWVVKTVVPLGDWQRRAIARAGRLERTAWTAGLAMARPVAPPAPAVGYWHDAGGFLVRVIERLDGHAAPSPADQPFAAWVGGTLARIAGLGLPGSLAEDASAPLHAVTEWRAWMEEAAAGRSPVAEPAGKLLPAVADATALVEAALAARPRGLLAHRDVGPANVLVTGSGYALLDWDHGGPAVPWWELVHTAFRCACPSGLLGPAARPSPAAVHGIVTAYLATGGAPGPADASAFAGMLHSTLNWAAYNLWLALGHRHATPARRVRAALHLAAASEALPHMLGSIDDWARLLT
jgi:hypothetical protein